MLYSWSGLTDKKEGMKITTGISNAFKSEEIEAYSNAGVDEFFVGYIPAQWRDIYGYEVSCNRREHSNYQYHTISELSNVVELIHKFGKKVYLTLNAHEYSAQQIGLLFSILKSIEHIEFDAFIVSNIALMLELRKSGFNIPFNISIGAGCNTIESFQFYLDNISGINKFILPRKFTVSELEIISEYTRNNDIKVEAFLLGDPCHFNDEYCFTWHGAQNESLCNSMMYTYRKAVPILLGRDWKKVVKTGKLDNLYLELLNKTQKIDRQRNNYFKNNPRLEFTNKDASKVNVLARINKCGLCMIRKFVEYGFDAVKLPLRGHSYQTNIEVIKIAKQIIEHANPTPQVCQKILNAPHFCSGISCYYNYPYAN